VSNPFYNRRSINSPSAFFGRSGQLEDVFARLNDARPQCISILGDRRFGKTSLLNYICQPGSRVGRTIPHQTLLVFPSFGANPPSDPRLFCHRLHEALGHATALATGPSLQSELSNSERLFNAPVSWQEIGLSLERSLNELGTRGWKIFFLLDEAEAIVESVPKEVLDFLRTLADALPQGCVGFIVASRLPMDIICPPEAHSKFSNLFCHKIRVANFEPQDVDQLLRKPLEACNVTFSPEDEAEIVKSAGLQPLAVQVAAYHALEMKTRGERVQAQKLIPKISADLEGQIAQWWLDFSPDEKATLRAIAVYKFGDLTDGDVADHLRTKGFLCGICSAPEIAPPCLAKWISRNIRDNVNTEKTATSTTDTVLISASTKARPTTGAKPLTIGVRFVRLAQARTMGRLALEFRHKDPAAAILDARLKATPILSVLPATTASKVIRDAVAGDRRAWREKAKIGILKMLDLSDYRMLAKYKQDLDPLRAELCKLLGHGIVDTEGPHDETSLANRRSGDPSTWPLGLQILSNDELQASSGSIRAAIEKHVADFLSGPLFFD
jgi:hypothetical protein